MRLVMKYFKCNNLIESNLSNRTGSNQMFFNFLTNSLKIAVLSDFKLSFIVDIEIVASGPS